MSTELPTRPSYTAVPRPRPAEPPPFAEHLPQEAEPVPVSPTFSVCIVVRDRPVLLVKAVESVLTNRFTDFEIMIVDDGSQIPVTEVLAKADVLFDNRIRVIRQPPTGIAPARNAGLRAAAGRYITVLDSDDELGPDALLRLDRLINSTGTRWVYADYEELYPNGSRKRIRLPEYPSARGMLMGVLTRPRLPFKHSGTTIERKLLEEIGHYDESLHIFEDIELILRALRAGVHPRHLAHPIIIFRRHDGNVTRNRLDGLGIWFSLIETYGPRNKLFRRSMIKLLRAMSEIGKWLVSIGR